MIASRAAPPDRLLDDGRGLWLLPLFFDSARLGVGRVGEEEYDDVWDYQDAGAAVDALVAWDGIGEPQGWYRHPKSGRRRPEGDAAREFIRQ